MIWLTAATALRLVQPEFNHRSAYQSLVPVHESRRGLMFRQQLRDLHRVGRSAFAEVV